jgi:Ca2+ transporting ATPase
MFFFLNFQNKFLFKKETAIAIAKEANILPKSYEHTKDSLQVMEGYRFQELSGGLKDDLKSAKDLFAFDKATEDLVVLARSTPENKYQLVTGLKELGNIVAVTGLIYKLINM